MRVMALAVMIMVVVFIGSNGYSAEGINETFEGFSIGPIDGQGNWTSGPTGGWDSISEVVSYPTHSGSRSLHLSGFVSNATYTVENPAPPNSTVTVSFWYREQYGFGTNDTGNNMSLRNPINLSDGYNQHTTYANICHAGTEHRSLLMTADPIGNGSCVNGVGDMTEGNWYFIEIEYDFENRTAHARVDGGDWGDTIDLRVYGGAGGSYITSFGAMSLWDNPPQFWFDDFQQTSVEPGNVTAPLYDEECLIITISEHSTFASYSYFLDYRKKLNHDGSDLSLTSDVSLTYSQATVGKDVHAICEGTVLDVRCDGKSLLGSEKSLPCRNPDLTWMKVWHPNCGGHDMIAYYGHIESVPANFTKESPDPVHSGDVLGKVMKYTRRSGHLHLTLDTDTQRDLTGKKYEMCEYIYDYDASYPGCNDSKCITSLSNCAPSTAKAKPSKGQILLGIGWGRVFYERYVNDKGRISMEPLYISPNAMRDLGFMDFFEIY